MKGFVRYFLILVSIATLTMASKCTVNNSLAAQHCDERAPYYHKIETGPGSLLADIFFLIPSTIIAVRASPAYAVPSQRSVASNAWCMPKNLIKHAREKVKTVNPLR